MGSVGSKARARGIHAGVKRLVTSSFAVLGVSSARATHIPGATYTGTHSGGGSVTFVVSADGGSITGFTIVNNPGSSCTLNRVRAPFAPISDYSFSSTFGGGFSVSGSFPAVRTASGSFTGDALKVQLTPR